MTELDASGRPSATFAGTFLDSDPSIANPNKLNCEAIMGKWTSGARVLDFRLSMGSFSGDLSFDHLYTSAGADNDDPVNRGAAAFRAAIINQQRTTAARMINYPIYVNVLGKRTTITDETALLARYDTIFTATYRAKIESAIPRLMFARDQGVMLGDGGEVWFDSKGRVIALNN